MANTAATDDTDVPFARSRTVRLSSKSILAIFSVLGACSVPGQAGDRVRPVVRQQLDSLTTIEIIGSRHWTVAMMNDSLLKYAGPTQGLLSHACQANLTTFVHFADAKVWEWINEEDGKVVKRSLVIAVREPGDSSRVRIRLRRTLDSTFRSEWREMTAMYLDSFPVFNPLLDRFFKTVDSNVYRHPADPLQRFLALHQSPTDLASALETLQHSPSAPDRAIAALILASAPSNAVAKQALFTAAVTSDWLDGEIAMSALHRMLRADPTMNWTPLLPSVHDMLEGASLEMLHPVIGLLLQYGGATPANAAPLLAHGGEMLTALIESSQEDVATLPRTLLIALRGEDLGDSPEVWRKWIATLQ